MIKGEEIYENKLERGETVEVGRSEQKKTK